MRPLRDPSSFPRTREGGFTFQVQQVIPEDLGRSLVAEALAGRVVVGLEELGEAGGGERGQIGLARQGAAQAPDGVLDAALLPGRVGVAEEGRDAKGMELMMAGELGAIVASDGLAPGGRQGCEEAGQGTGDGGGGFAGRPDREEQAGVAFVEGEDGLAVGAEEHEVGLPVAGRLAVRGDGRAVEEGAAVGDKEAELPPLRPRQPRFALARGR